MAYDFTTDIKNFTRLDSVSNSIVSWALDQAITVYTAADPGDYDDTISDIDNRLISILASAFVVMWNNGIELPTMFKLDEFTVEEDSSGKSPEQKYFDMFWIFKRMYDRRGISLQFADTAGVMALSEYDSTIYEIDRTPETGLTE